MDLGGHDFSQREDEFIRVKSEEENSSSQQNQPSNLKGRSQVRRSMNDGQIEETRTPITIDIPQGPQDLEDMI